MGIYVGGHFMLMNGASNLTAKSSDGPSLVVDSSQGTPTSDKKYLWKYVPLFSDDYQYLGFGIQSELNGKFIRGNPDMPNGGGVSLVDASGVDAWAGWKLGGPVAGYAASYVPLILGPKSSPDQICVMTLFGGSGWGPGTQVITYQWGSAQNQLWSPGFQTQ